MEIKDNEMELFSRRLIYGKFIQFWLKSYKEQKNSKQKRA